MIYIYKQAQVYKTAIKVKIMFKKTYKIFWINAQKKEEIKVCMNNLKQF